MGISGIMDYISVEIGRRRRRKGGRMLRKQLQTVDMKIRIDCDGCEMRVKKALSSLKGVINVEIDRKINKVSVNGYVDEDKVMKRAASTGKKPKIWPFIAYNAMKHTNISECYAKRAPPGHVRRIESSVEAQSSFEHSFITMFSDENPNSCSIM